MKTNVRPTPGPSKPQGGITEPFILVPRALLALHELCLTDAMVLSHVRWRDHERKTVTAPELVALTGLHRSSVYECLKRLQRAGWLDESWRPDRKLPTGKDGSIPVLWREVRELGRSEAVVFSQLKSLPTLDKAKKVKDWNTKDGTMAPPGMVARMVGLCRDTTRSVLKRLASGDTVRSRLCERQGKTVEHVAVIAATRTHEGRTGCPRVRVRLAPERVPAPAAAKVPPAAPKPPAHYPADFLASVTAGLAEKAWGRVPLGPKGY